MKDYPNPKNLQKGIEHNFYRAIMGQPWKWKILTAEIRKGIYFSQKNLRTVPR